MGRRTSGASDLVTITADLVHQTDRAWLVRTDRDKEVWLPKGQCERDGNEFEMPEWLAIEKELI